jgi:hypothetical protein
MKPPHCCPDCRVPLLPLKLDLVPRAATIKYTARDAELSFWTASYPWAGEMKPEICPECGLVQWYGDVWGQERSPLPLPGTPPAPDGADLPRPGDPPEADGP